MFKKIMTMIILAACLVIVGGQNNQVEAADYYIGSFRVSGAKGYIMTESIQHTAETAYRATLKAVFPSGEVQIIYYSFDNGYERGRVTFRNSDGNSGNIDSYDTPVEYNMWRYIFKYINGHSWNW